MDSLASKPRRWKDNAMQTLKDIEAAARLLESSFPSDCTRMPQIRISVHDVDTVEELDRWAQVMQDKQIECRNGVNWINGTICGFETSVFFEGNLEVSMESFLVREVSESAS